MKVMRLLATLAVAGAVLGSCATSGSKSPKDPTDDDPRTMMALGDSAAAHGEWAEAVKFYEASIAKDATQALPHNNLGLAYLNLRMFDKAAASLRKALQINPGYCDANNNLGTTLAMSGDRAGAKEQFGISAACPGYSTPHTALYNLGSLQMEDGEFNAAIESFRGAWEKRPDFIPAGLGLGNALMKAGRLREACSQFDACVKSFPQNCDALYAHATCLYEAKQYEYAAAAFEKVIQACPGTDPAKKSNEYLGILRGR